jgi:hypothetical protein
MIRIILVTNVSTGSSYGTLIMYLFVGENPTRITEHLLSLTNIFTGSMTNNAQ